MLTPGDISKILKDISSFTQVVESCKYQIVLTTLNPEMIDAKPPPSETHKNLKFRIRYKLKMGKVYVS